VLLGFFVYTPLSQKIKSGDKEDDKKAQEIKEKVINAVLARIPKYSDLQKKKE
jgi:hypothetical protein